MPNTNTSTLVEESLKITAELDASKAITVATALGAKIASPVGTHLYLAMDDRGWVILGAYQKEEDAQKAVISNMIEIWKRLSFYPWDSKGNPIELSKQKLPRSNANILSPEYDNSTYNVEFEKNYLDTHSFEEIIEWAIKAWDSMYSITRIDISRSIEDVQTAMLNPMRPGY